MTLTVVALTLSGLAGCVTAYVGWFTWDSVRRRMAERRRFDRDIENYERERIWIPAVLRYRDMPGTAPQAPFPCGVTAPDARVSAALRQLIAGGSKDSAAAMLRLPTAAAACADTAEWCAVTEDILRKHGWRP